MNEFKIINTEYSKRHNKAARTMKGAAMLLLLRTGEDWKTDDTRTEAPHTIIGLQEEGAGVVNFGV